MSFRKRRSMEVRRDAAELATARHHPRHVSNGDEQRHRFVNVDPEHDGKNGYPKRNGKPSYIGNFTKCLPHDDDGFVHNPLDYDAWVRSIDSGDERDIAAIPIGPPHQDPATPTWSGPYAQQWVKAGKEVPVRGWESQGAGLTYDLEGPDAQSVTMPPAPSLDSQELIAEIAEVCWMALCRDVPFADWNGNATIDAARKSLAQLSWFRRDRTIELTGGTDRLPSSLARRRILSEAGTDPVPLGKLFRGVNPGERTGPYLSQFLLIGNRGLGDVHAIAEGYIAYGSLRVDQRVRVVEPGIDYMQNFKDWLDVQNGADVRGTDKYVHCADKDCDDFRFLATPRDLATYVHNDALYEAYLNACLILLSLRAPFDPGLPFLAPDHIDKQLGFAQFGGPHILTLVAEVATRALKAVRYQKYNIHRRLRPEALGGWLYQRLNGSKGVKERLAVLADMEQDFRDSGLGDALGKRNNKRDNWLLPMAFPEGSPTHPSYGAGHASVAGACVTILKAWFDHGWQLKDSDGAIIGYQPSADGKCLVDASLPTALTVEGELNKVAGNIAIGRDWAGVHYYTDYFESFRLGEQVAIELLEEQKLSYGENFSMTVPLADGTTVRI